MQKSIFKNQKGQGLIEYLIIVAIMAVSTIGIVSLMGQTVKGKFAQVTYGLRGDKPPKVKFDHVNASDYSAKDMSDFFHGADKSKQIDNDNQDSGL